MPEQRSPLYAFHLILVATATLFCLGFAAYQFTPYSNATMTTRWGLAAFFAAAGLVAAWYLSRVLRYGLSARPSPPDGDSALERPPE